MTEMNLSIRPGRYRHYKGKEYEVIGVARHSETEESLVVYRTCYGQFDLCALPTAGMKRRPPSRNQPPKTHDTA
jgi:hypothetical protein